MPWPHMGGIDLPRSVNGQRSVRFRGAVLATCEQKFGPLSGTAFRRVGLYRFRTRCRISELRFGAVGGLGHDRGSCLPSAVLGHGPGVRLAALAGPQPGVQDAEIMVLRHEVMVPSFVSSPWIRR